MAYPPTLPACMAFLQTHPPNIPTSFWEHLSTVTQSSTCVEIEDAYVFAIEQGYPHSIRYSRGIVPIHGPTRWLNATRCFESAYGIVYYKEHPMEPPVLSTEGPLVIRTRSRIEPLVRKHSSLQ